MRIASYNIRKGGSRGRAAIADVITALDPDVTILQEATDPEVVAWLARKVGNPFWVSRPGASVALLGRREPDDVQWHAIGPNRSCLEIAMTDAVRVFGIHMSSGLSRWGERRRLRELGVILELIGDEAARRRTMIVGDFNSIAPGDSLAVATLPTWIRMLLRLDGGIQTEVMASVRAAGFVDAYRRFQPKDGATLPSAAPVVRLDYAMVGADLMETVKSCSIGGVSDALLRSASDHLPMLTVLDVEGAGSSVQAPTGIEAETPASSPPPTNGPQTSAKPGLEREGRPGLDDVDGSIGDASRPPTPAP
jgi:endonuclease/exonuclease/phosphatase family metal-dependent hydrolase